MKLYFLKVGHDDMMRDDKLFGKGVEIFFVFLLPKFNLFGGISAPTPLQHFIRPFHDSLVKVKSTLYVSLETTEKSPSAADETG